MSIRTMDIKDLKGFKLGNAENHSAGTGVTAIICENGAVAGVDVRGGAPATRETDLLRSENMVSRIHSVVLSGGSCFGLEAASGVQKELSSMGIGDNYFGTNIPIVCGASLFDLCVGSAEVFPDTGMGAAAVRNAYKGVFYHGNAGAGTGATVGKIKGMARAMKTGLGTYACSDGKLELGAIVAVNAVADVYDGSNRIIAGLTNEDGTRIEGSIKSYKEMLYPAAEETVKPASNESSEVSSESEKYDETVEESTISKFEKARNLFKSRPVNVIQAEFDPVDDNSDNVKNSAPGNSPFNTTIGCLITNAKLTKSQCNKLATILHDAYARAIKPVHTTADGDTIFVMTTDEVEVNFDSFAALATDIMQYSIIDGAISAKSEYGLRAACDIKRQ